MKRKYLIYLILYGISIIGCDRSDTNGFLKQTDSTGIVGGTEALASDENIKSVVGLYLDEKTGNQPLRQLCTGSLIG